MTKEVKRKSAKESYQDMIKIIGQMSGRYSPYDIFNDWITVMALTIQNSLDVFHDEVWRQREKTYCETMNKYSLEERWKFVEMFYELSNIFESGELYDVLGSIYMESRCGNKNTGQFFTPFQLSKLCAELTIPEDVSEDKPYEINEPSTGGGGMMIATAAVLRERGRNYQKCMKVIAQDLDWKGVYMTYVQLSLLGIDAVVVQGDTLREPYVSGKTPKNRVFLTPKKMGALI